MGDGSAFIGQTGQLQKKADRHAGWDRNRREIDEEPLWSGFPVSELSGDEPHDRGGFLSIDSRTKGANEDGVRAESHLSRRKRLILPGRGAAGGGEVESHVLVRVLHARTVEYVLQDWNPCWRSRKRS